MKGKGIRSRKNNKENQPERLARLSPSHQFSPFDRCPTSAQEEAQLYLRHLSELDTNMASEWAMQTQSSQRISAWHEPRKKESHTKSSDRKEHQEMPIISKQKYSSSKPWKVRSKSLGSCMQMARAISSCQHSTIDNTIEPLDKIRQTIIIVNRPSADSDMIPRTEHLQRKLRPSRMQNQNSTSTVCSWLIPKLYEGRAAKKPHRSPEESQKKIVKIKNLLDRGIQRGPSKNWFLATPGSRQKNRQNKTHQRQKTQIPQKDSINNNHLLKQLYRKYYDIVDGVRKGPHLL